MTEHSDDCIRARAGHRFERKDPVGRLYDNGPDPYPLLRDLSGDQRAAVLGCGHADHDVVRLFVSLVGRP